MEIEAKKFPRLSISAPGIKHRYLISIIAEAKNKNTADLTFYDMLSYYGEQQGDKTICFQKMKLQKLGFQSKGK